MDERGIYEIRKSQIQNFYIESFSDEWLLVVKNLTRKETPSTNSIAIPHAALMRLLEIVSDKITLHEKSRKLQFQGEDAEDLFEKNADNIETKRYRERDYQFLILYTEVLNKGEAHEDKVEIYLQKHSDSPINLCLGIRSWKSERPSKMGLDLKEEMLVSLYEKLADLKMLTTPPHKNLQQDSDWIVCVKGKWMRQRALEDMWEKHHEGHKRSRVGKNVEPDAKKKKKEESSSKINKQSPKSC